MEQKSLVARKMRLSNSQNPSPLDPKNQRRSRQSGRSRHRQFLVTATVLLASACAATVDPIQLTPAGFKEGYVGGAVSDDPRATVVAFETLSAGGTVADAAVAMTFALSVTNPAAAGLGGGGACLIYDGVEGAIESLNFLPRAGAQGGPIAVPGTARGMEALHRRYGVLSWDNLVVQAEGLARRGTPISQSLALPLAAAAKEIQADANLAALFLGPDGAALAPGAVLKQIELAAVLAQIRVRGASDLYAGQSARTFLEGAAEAGALLTLADLRAYAPAWSDTLSLELAGEQIHVVPGVASGGVVAGQLWAMLAEDPRYLGGDESARAHLFAEASARAYGDQANAAANPLSVFRAQTLMSDVSMTAKTAFAGGGLTPKVSAEDAGATGFVVTDRNGSVVACTLTMGRAFGVGRTARPTGIILSPTPKDVETESMLAPVLVLRPEIPGVALAGAAGGPAGPAAIAGLLLGVQSCGLEAALAAPRLVHPGAPDQVLMEARATPGQREGLSQRGHRIREFLSLGLVNGMTCGFGAEGQRTCLLAADPRGGGWAAGGAKP